MRKIYTFLSVLIIGILSSYATGSVNLKNNPAQNISKMTNIEDACEGTPDYIAGYNAGHLIGYNLGVNEGTIDGSLVCYNSGYRYGSIDGYNTGYADGHIDGSTLNKRTRSNNKINVAVNTATTECYDLGFANGQTDGHIAGYSVGYNTEALNSYDLGYDSGFADGYDNGYDDGFGDGFVKVYNPHYNPIDYPDKYPDNNSGCNLTGIISPILNATDFTSYYKSDSYAADNVIGLSPGSAGANRTWDFSGLSVALDGTFDLAPVASTPYTGDFPTANFSFKSTFIGDTDPYYSYYKTSPTTAESVGGANSMGTNLEIDHSTLFQFPYVYNTVINDTYQDVGDIIVSSFTSTYDGYGTLITPYGTYTNVIRQKRVEVDGTYTYTDYNWFSTNPFKYIMSVGFLTNGTDSSNYVSVFSNFAPLSLAEFNKKSVVKVYPNPAISEIRLQLPDAVILDKIVVIDISGKIVIRQSENLNQIDVEKLPSGLYILESYSGKDKFQNKFVKE